MEKKRIEIKKLSTWKRLQNELSKCSESKRRRLGRNLSEENLDVFSDHIMSIARHIKDNNVDTLVVPLRGAYPIAHLVTVALKEMGIKLPQYLMARASMHSWGAFDSYREFLMDLINFKINSGQDVNSIRNHIETEIKKPKEEGGEIGNTLKAGLEYIEKGKMPRYKGPVPRRKKDTPTLYLGKLPKKLKKPRYSKPKNMLMVDETGGTGSVIEKHYILRKMFPKSNVRTMALYNCLREEFPEVRIKDGLEHLPLYTVPYSDEEDLLMMEARGHVKGDLAKTSFLCTSNPLGEVFYQFMRELIRKKARFSI